MCVSAFQLGIKEVTLAFIYRRLEGVSCARSDLRSGACVNACQLGQVGMLLRAVVPVAAVVKQHIAMPMDDIGMCIKCTCICCLRNKCALWVVCTLLAP